MRPRLDRIRVVAGKEDERGPQSRSLEDPRRDHLDGGPTFVLCEDRALHFVERGGGMLGEVVVGPALEAPVEVDHRCSTLSAECGPARREEPEPSLAIDPVALGPGDVAPKLAACRMLEEASRDLELVLPEAPQPVGHRATPVSDVDRPRIERRHRTTDQLIRYVAGKRGDRLHAGQAFAVDQRGNSFRHAREEHVDPERSHARGDLVDPAVLVLNELHLQTPEPTDPLRQLERQIGIEGDDDGVVDDNRVEVFEIQLRAAVSHARIDANDVMPRVPRQSTDVIDDIAGVARIVVTEQQHRRRRSVRIAHLRATM